MRPILALVMAIGLSASFQAQPPSIHFLFNEGGGSTTLNQGVSSFGNKTLGSLSVDGQTRNGSSCLKGPGGLGSGLNTGAQPALSGGFAVGFAINTEANGGAYQYVMGGATNFKCLVAAAADDITLKGSFPDVTIPGGGGASGWVHVAWVFDEVQEVITPYLDGRPMTPVATGPLTVLSNNLHVGGHSFSSTRLETGSLMEDFRFYERKLDDAAIKRWSDEALARGEFSKVMLTEISWAPIIGVEITNFSDQVVDLSDWRVRLSILGTTINSSLLGVHLQPGEIMLVTEPGNVPEAPFNVHHDTSLLSLDLSSVPFMVALLDGDSIPADEVRVRGTAGTNSTISHGGAFRGQAVRFANDVCIERDWGLDTNSGRDWTRIGTRSFGLQNLSAGTPGYDTILIKKVVINEIDANANYLELRNVSPEMRDLKNWFFLKSVGNGTPLERIDAFPGSLFVGVDGYAVLGETLSWPPETPWSVPYVDLVARGYTLGLDNSEFTLALYDDLGRPVDVVRTTGLDNQVVHNHPRAPGDWFSFRGSAGRHSFGIALGRQPSSNDSNTGDDFTNRTTRSMGYDNLGYGLGASHTPDISVRVNATGLGDGLTMIVDGLPSVANQPWGFIVDVGHLSGTGPMFGIGANAITNFLVLQNAGLFQPLSGIGTARIDIPSNTIPIPMALDLIAFALDDTGTLQRTLILELDI